MEMGMKTDSQINLASSTSQSSGMVFKLFAIIAFICTIVALVAVILSAVAMSNSKNMPIAVNTGSQSGTPAVSDGSTSNSGGAASQMTTPAKKWLIALGHDWGSYEYIDDTGYLVGFSHELVRAVCEAAGMDCQTVWDPYTNCWQSKAGEHPRAGPGIMGRWYDACTGWSQTLERVHVLRFSKPYLKPGNSAFFTLPGSNFNRDDFTGKKIAFFDGWVQDEKCLARSGITGTPLDIPQIVHVAGPDQMKQKILSREVDAGFAMDDVFHNEVQNRELTVTAVDMSCALAGGGMMTRKDSTFNDEFNRGLDKIMSNGVYKTLCNNANANHNKGPVLCLNA